MLFCGLAEEALLAYKDVDEVVSVVEGAGIAMITARMKLVAVIKRLAQCQSDANEMPIWRIADTLFFE